MRMFLDTISQILSLPIRLSADFLSGLPCFFCSLCKCLLMEELDTLLFAHFANQQSIIFFYNDVVVQTLHDHFSVA